MNDKLKIFLLMTLLLIIGTIILFYTQPNNTHEFVKYIMEHPNETIKLY